MRLMQLIAVAGLVFPVLTFGQDKPEPEYLNVAYVYDSAAHALTWKSSKSKS